MMQERVNSGSNDSRAANAIGSSAVLFNVNLEAKEVS